MIDLGVINLGPIIFGFIIGIIVGLSIKNNPNNPIKFTTSSYIIVFIVAIIVAWQLRAFPYYTDFPIATGFISGFIGLIVGKTMSKVT
jgi:energy-converting hydrogenase B subunit J